MRNYEYRAHNLAGRLVVGTIRANTKEEAYEQLSQDKLVPVDIRSAVASEEGGSLRLFAERIKDESIILFTRQLGAMLKAGIPVVQTMDILRDQVENRRLKKVLAGVGRTVSAGSRLSEAMAEFPRVFSKEYRSIVVSGESGGDLVKALASVADWMERELEIRKTVKAAMRYPIMVCIALLGAAIVMLTFVIPKFAEFFADSPVQLPLPTRMLLSASHIIQNTWPLLIVGAVLLGAGGFFLMRVRQVRLFIGEMKFRIRIVGPLYTKIVVARFGRIFSMLIRNGVPVLKGLEVSASIVPNEYFTKLIGNVRQFIQDGNTIADGFVNEMPIFPPMVNSLIAVGERTGSLDDMLEQVVDFYDAEVRYALNNLTAMIEPIITVVVGAGVLFLSLSIFLPIWNMSQALLMQAQ